MDWWCKYAHAINTVCCHNRHMAMQPRQTLPVHHIIPPILMPTALNPFPHCHQPMRCVISHHTPPDINQWEEFECQTRSDWLSNSCHSTQHLGYIAHVTLQCKPLLNMAGTQNARHGIVHIWLGCCLYWSTSFSTTNSDTFGKFTWTNGRVISSPSAMTIYISTYSLIEIHVFSKSISLLLLLFPPNSLRNYSPFPISIFTKFPYVPPWVPKCHLSFWQIVTWVRC